MFFTLESITHTQHLALPVFDFHGPHNLTLLSQKNSISPTRGPPQTVSTLVLAAFPSQSSQWGLFWPKKREFPQMRSPHTATEPCQDSSTVMTSWAGMMFHISELWALNSTGQMFHGSFWISSPVKPRQPKRGNLFFLLFFLFSFLISKMSFNYVSLFLTGFLIMKVIDCSSYKLWVKASHLF